MKNIFDKYFMERICELCGKKYQGHKKYKTRLCHTCLHTYSKTTYLGIDKFIKAKKGVKP